jgi:positive regulator of sigma E activity
MEKQGVVREIKPNKVLVEIFDNSGECMGCRLHAICKPGKTGGAVEFDCARSFSVGDKVVVDIPEGRSILASFFLFIVTLFVLAGAYFLFSALGLADPLYVLASVGVSAVAFLTVLLFDKKSSPKR